MPTRKPIPPVVAAKALFIADRTCCVCRTRRKPVQIHHIDGDPGNNDLSNLAVLCLDCHRETQITGGFDRKLDVDQVRLYRDDWTDLVRRGRVASDQDSALDDITEPNDRTQLVAALVEIYKEAEDYLALARLHARLGNDDLRDEYIERALERDPPAWEEVLLRRVQRRIDLLPADKREEALKQVEEDWTLHASFLRTFGRVEEAARVYLQGIQAALDEGRVFSAAYYMKYGVDEALTKSLFEQHLAAVTKDGDLWWQMRCLEELGWESEKQQLLVAHAAEIDASDDTVLKAKLAEAQGDRRRTIELEKTEARERIATYRQVREEEADKELG